MKLKAFCKAKDMVNSTKQQSIELEKFFTNTTSDRRLVSKIDKELKKLDIKTNNPMKMVYIPKQKILKNIKCPRNT